MTTAAQVLVGLHTAFQTLDGLKAILDYEPTAITDTPVMYSLLDEVTPTRQGSLDVPRYRFLHRICFAWLDNRGAEQQLLFYADAVYQALEEDPYLGGLITLGRAKISDQSTGFILVGSALFRVLDSYSDVLAKR